MGIVYEAEQGSLGRRVALKVLLAQALANPQQVRRFEREARAAGRLHHTNIVPVFGVGREGDHALLRDAVHPGPAAERGARRAAAAARAVGRPAGQAAVRPVRTAADGRRRRPLALGRAIRPRPAHRRAGSTATCHRRHRRPRRVGPRPPPVAGTPVGADSNAPGPLGRCRRHSGRPYVRSGRPAGHPGGRGAGLRRAARASSTATSSRRTSCSTSAARSGSPTSAWPSSPTHDDLTQTGDILGTLRYMAPERFRGRTDVRSRRLRPGPDALRAAGPAAGVRGDRPVAPDRPVTQAEPPHLLKLDPAIPRDLATIVHKAIARDPSDRYPTAGELADDLRRFLEDRPIPARRLEPGSACPGGGAGGTRRWRASPPPWPSC